MREFTLAFMGLSLLLLSVPTRTHAKSDALVDCVYPGEQLGNALSDLAAQLGYQFEANPDDDVQLDQTIWVLARNAKPEQAAAWISASSGWHVNIDHAGRRVKIVEAEPETVNAPEVRAFDVSKQVNDFVEYQDRFGERVEQEGAETGGPTSAEQLQLVAEEVLDNGFDMSFSGSAVGRRLIFTAPRRHISQVDEFLALIASTQGGESRDLALDRDHRAHLASIKSDTMNDTAPVSTVLWQLFKDCQSPVFLDRSILDWLSIEDDLSEISPGVYANHREALFALAREQEFAVDGALGAIRLQMLDWEGSGSYRVFEVTKLLEQIEEDYKEMKTDDDLVEGYTGDIQREGGVNIIVRALEQQLENAGHSAMVLSYGSRVVVVGGVELVDTAVEVLKALGWDNAPEPGEDK